MFCHSWTLKCFMCTTCTIFIKFPVCFFCRCILNAFHFQSALWAWLNVTFHSFSHLHAQNFITFKMSYNLLNSDSVLESIKLFFWKISSHQIFIYQKGSWLEWVKGHVNDNYYARFDTCSYHSCKETDWREYGQIDRWIDECMGGWKTELICRTLQNYMSPAMRKCVLGSLQPGNSQIDLLSHRDQPESWNFRCINKRYHSVLAANNKGADQTVQMRRLICAFVVRIWHKTHFLMAWLI